MNLPEAIEYFKSINAFWRGRKVVTRNATYLNENKCHTVNIYSHHREIDSFSFGDFAKDNTSLDEFWIAVAEHDKGQETSS